MTCIHVSIVGLSRQKADTKPAFFSLSYNFLFSTSYLNPAHENEVRDDGLH